MLSTTKTGGLLLRRLSVAAIFILAVLTTIGTGGGGGGDGNGTTPGVPTTPLTITSTNAVDVAEYAASTVTLTEAVAAYGSLSYAYGISITKHQIQKRLRAIFEHAKEGLNKITHPDAPGLPQGVHVEIEGQCNTGTASIVWDDANDNDLLSGGETLQMTFSNCHNTMLGTTLNGRTTLRMNSITGNPQNDATDWSVNMTTTDENASVQDAYGTTTFNGSMTMTITNNAAANTYRLQLEGTSYTATYDGNVAQLTNFSFSTLLNSALDTYEVDADYTLADSEMGGVITVVTNPVFSGAYDSALDELGNPTAGKMTITGAGGIILTIEPYDDVNAMVSLDTNGDGTAENTWQVPWVNLE